jgi:hypothetical protein
MIPLIGYKYRLDTSRTQLQDGHWRLKKLLYERKAILLMRRIVRTPAKPGNKT